MKRFCLFLLLIAFTISGAHAAEKRIALLIGNKNYVLDKLDLKNPHNDIAHVAAALKKVGFEVTTVKDASLGTLQIALRRYTRRLRKGGPGAIGFLYYSGHGALNEETRTNYLIPVDVKNIDSVELWDSSVRLRRVLDELKSQAGNAQHFVVFDACRNSLQLASKTSKSLLQTKGFKAEREVRGMLISYATAEGRTASDIGDKVGPYARALAAEIVKPGVEAVTMFRNVQLAVQEAINQEPWLTYGALGKTYFAGKEGPNTSESVASSKPPLSEVAREWELVRNSKSRAVLKAFKSKHKDPVYQALAVERLKELNEPDVAAVPKPEMPVVLLPAAKPLVGIFSRKFRYGETFKDCDGCPEMVVVHAGSFTMGSPEGEESRYDDEGPQHKVTISKPFAAGRFEVTRGQFDAFVKATGHTVGNRCWTYEGEWKERRGRSYRNPGFSQADNDPVVCVNWHDAKAYVKWINGKIDGSPYRLLSEAEWEYAARAGTMTPFWWGSKITTDQANYDGNYTYNSPKGKLRKMTVSVNSFRPNAFGLYNVHGNVWEWVEDCWHGSYKGAPTDGSAWLKADGGDCAKRVLRGGSWYVKPQVLRSAYRSRYFSDDRYHFFGFRLSRTLN